MFYTFAVCFLITHHLNCVQSKAVPDQYDRYNHSDPSLGWANPSYRDSYYGQGDFRPGDMDYLYVIFNCFFFKYKISIFFNIRTNNNVFDNHDKTVVSNIVSKI